MYLLYAMAIVFQCHSLFEHIDAFDILDLTNEIRLC